MLYVCMNVYVCVCKYIHIYVSHIYVAHSHIVRRVHLECMKVYVIHVYECVYICV